MSETTSVETNTEITAKEDKVKKEKDKTNSQDPDPYCCTPPDGDGGPDTKP